MTDERRGQLVSWSALVSAITMALTVGGVIISMTIWVYSQLNSQRNELLQFRTEVAQTYVTLMGLKQMEDRSNQLRGELMVAIRDLGNRLDNSFDKLDKRIHDRTRP